MSLKRLSPFVFATLLLVMTFWLASLPGQATVARCDHCQVGNIPIDLQNIPEVSPLPAPTMPEPASAISALVYPSNFQPPEIIETGHDTNYHSKMVDMNNDDLQDLVITAINGGPRDIFIYPQTVTGDFTTPIVLTTTGYSAFDGYYMDTGDLNGDGLQDIIYTRDGFFDDNHFSINFQQPDNSFAQPVTYYVPLNPVQPVVADFNDDGRDDLAINMSFIETHIFYQTISGTLTAPLVLSDPSYTTRFLLQGDMNDDTLPDIIRIALADGEGFVVVHKQTATGFLDPIYATIPYEQVDDAAIGDLNDDGLNDAVVIGRNGPNHEVVVLTQTMTGNLEIAATIINSGTEANVVIADVDQDGRNDIILGQEDVRRIAVHYQAEDGTFERFDLFDDAFGSAYHENTLNVGDLGGDGLPDVVVADPAGDIIVMRHSGFIYRNYFSLLMQNLDSPIYDDFSDPTSGWPIATTSTNLYAYHNNRYRIVNLTGAFTALATAGHLRQHYDIEVDINKVGSAKGGYGIAFNLTDNFDEFLVHLVWPDYDEIWVMSYNVNSGFTVLLTANSANVVNGGEQVNRLRVRYKNGFIRTYVNGFQIHSNSTAITHSQERRIGFFTAPIDYNFDSRFDNYSVEVP